MVTRFNRIGHANGRHTALRSTWQAQNVGETERWASVLGGSLLSLYGLSRYSLEGLLPTVLGAALIYRGVTGHCSVYGALGLSSACRRGRATSVPAGKAMEAGEQPASWMGRGRISWPGEENQR